MSDSAAQLAGGLVGAALGSFVGAPQLGFALGSALAGAIVGGGDDRTVTGPRLDDLRASPSQYGEAVGIPYGTVKVPGTVIWLENNELKETKNVEESSGGKGGGSSQKTVTFTYSATFAVSLGEGPVEGIRRIWADTVLIYDGSENASAEAILAGALLLSGNDGSTVFTGGGNDTIGSITAYLGTETQKPDPAIEADRGVGNVPGYRGEAYLVLQELELEKFGNRLPQISVEVTSETTSAPRSLGWAQLPTIDQWENSDDLGRTDWIRFENDLVIINAGLDDPRVTAGDPENNADFRFTPDLTFLGYEPNGWKSHFNSGIEFESRIGVTNAFAVHAQFNTNKPLEIAAVDRGEKIFTFARGFDSFTDVGAVVTPDGRHVYLFERGSSETTYKKYDVDFDVVETGTIEGNPTVGIAGDTTDADSAKLAVQSDGQLLWREVATTIELYQLGNEKNYMLRGSATTENNTSANDGGLVAENGLCWRIERTRLFEVFSGVGAATQGTQPLKEIVDDIVERAGIDAADVDTTALTDDVRGYYLERPMTGQDALSALRQAFMFDVVPVGYKLEFLPRGQASVATLTDDDLAAHEIGQERPAIVSLSRELETRLPRRLKVQYLDIGTDYEQGIQYAGRLATEAVSEETVSLSVVLSADEAAQVADVLLREAWAARTEYQAVASWQQAALTPGDVVDLGTSTVKDSARITQIDDGRPGLRTLTLVPDQANVYESSATGQQGENNTVSPSSVGPTDAVAIDTTTLRDRDEGPGYYVAMAGLNDGWRGAQWFRSADGTAFSPVVATTTSATIGRTNTALPSGPVGIWDRASTVTVRLGAGDLTSATETEVLNGANALAVASGNDWEIIQFTDVEQNSDGSLVLSNLLRGRKGTEAAVDGHAKEDRIVLLDDAVQRVEINADSIDSGGVFRAVSIGQKVARASDISFTPQGVSLMPLSPVHVAGSRDGSDNLTITWIRRGRLSGEWRNRVGVPLGEESESYEVDILDGGTVVRTLTSSSESVTYSASDQITDFGATQDSVKVKIYQISATVGRGFAKEATA